MMKRVSVEFGDSDELIWRVLANSSIKLLANKGSYEIINGLSALGLDSCNLPLLESINFQLASVGWKALPVDGFVNSKDFFSSLANQILPICTTLRKWNELYFSAEPDYFHEGFGHLALIGVPRLSKLLKKYGEIGQKCFSNENDRQYLQLLSDNIRERKRMPDKNNPIIAELEKDEVSELIKLTRLGWWTFETGLVLEQMKPKAWGAAIISSLHELTNFDTKPIFPLSIDCVWDHFDPSAPQNHYYMATSYDHIMNVLEEFEANLAYSKGGYSGCLSALKSGSSCEILLKNGAKPIGKVKDIKNEFAIVKILNSSQKFSTEHINMNDVVSIKPF